MKSVVVTGATSLVGYFLVPRLLQQGFSVTAISRRQQPEDFSSNNQLNWIQRDIVSDNIDDVIERADFLIHLAPLWLLPKFLSEYAHDSALRVLAFSSTSRLSKQSSENLLEQQVARQLADAEDAIADIARRLGTIHWTIFRPTLIYGAGRDQNVSSIARFILRYGFFPVIGQAKGLRQPVHADDLCQACMSCLEKKETINKIYTLSGGETLPYHLMVERIFNALGKPVRIIRLPETVFRAGIKLISKLPHFSHLTPEMASRMNKDLVFDTSDAVADFDYQPRAFNPCVEDIVRASNMASE